MDKVKPKMSTRPPVPQSAEEFIMEAATVATVQPSSKVKRDIRYPWQEPNVRADVVKSVNLRLSEEFILKLQYLSDQTGKSQQKIIREVLIPHLEDELNKVIQAME
jgi:hypothetical protein